MVSRYGRILKISQYARVGVRVRIRVEKSKNSYIVPGQLLNASVSTRLCSRVFLDQGYQSPGTVAAAVRDIQGPIAEQLLPVHSLRKIIKEVYFERLVLKT